MSKLIPTPYRNPVSIVGADMTPDELERLPAPPICRTCGHWVLFRSMDGNERQLCGKLVPQHPQCRWHIPRTHAAGGEKCAK